MSWTPERIKIAHDLYVVQGQSAALVARALGPGVTRNAVIGKASRMGWGRPEPRHTAVSDRAQQRRDAISVERQARRERRAAANVAKGLVVRKMNEEARPKPPRVEGMDLSAIASPNARPWLERRAGECTWPLGDGPDFHSCCNPTARGSWCAEHAAIGREGPQVTAERRRTLSKWVSWVAKRERQGPRFGA